MKINELKKRTRVNKMEVMLPYMIIILGKGGRKLSESMIKLGQTAEMASIATKAFAGGCLDYENSK
jgi:uncharacterized membrane protein YebE (DUF533 family)